MRLLYNVTTHVDHEISVEWLNYMEQFYIPKMMEGPYFESFKMMKILGDENDTGITFAVQYVARDLDHFISFQEKLLPQLTQAQRSLFLDKCVSFKTLMEIIAD